MSDASTRIMDANTQYYEDHYTMEAIGRVDGERKGDLVKQAKWLASTLSKHNVPMPNIVNSLKMLRLMAATEEDMPNAVIVEITDEACGIHKASANDDARLETSAPDGLPFTPLGNAQRLIKLYGNILRYNINERCWMIWDDKRWRKDKDSEIMRLARDVVYNLYAALVDCSSPEARDKVFKWARKSETDHHLTEMVKLAQSEPGVTILSTDLDADPFLFNALNGTIDLRTGELKPHSQSDLISKLANIVYDPKATAPRFERFLEEIFPDFEKPGHPQYEVIDFLQKAVGYMMTADVREQCCFLFVGKEGSNGKSVLVGTMEQIWGDYMQDTPPQTFTEKRDANTSDLAGLVGNRAITGTESEDKKTFDEALLKRLTGGDRVTCRFMYAEWFSYYPTYKIIIATNEVPLIKSQNHAMRRRIKLIPFRQHFYYPWEQMVPVRDETLKDKLTEELPGILNWCIEGCLRWQSEGLDLPPILQEEVNMLFEQMDPLIEFIEDCCAIGARQVTTPKEMWGIYKAWCEQHGDKPYYKTTASLSRAILKRNGIWSTKERNERMIRGIGPFNKNADTGSTQYDTQKEPSEPDVFDDDDYDTD